MKHTLRNYLMIPVVMLVRFPIVLTLLSLSKSGYYAEKIYDCISDKLPSLESKD